MTPVNGPLALAAMTLALVTFPVAFNLGTYGEVLYPDVLKLVVASFILLILTFRGSREPSEHIWLKRAALASLPLWLAFAAVFIGSTGEASDSPIFAVWLALTAVVAVPVTLKLLVDMFTPNLNGLRGRHLRWLAAVVVSVALAGFIMGTENPRFLICSDFTLAGAAEPDNCAR
jgi:hypothetical protein